MSINRDFQIVSVHPKTGTLELKKEVFANILQNVSSKNLPVGIISVLGGGHCDSFRTTHLLTSFLIEYYESGEGGESGGWIEHLLFGNGTNSSPDFPKVWEQNAGEGEQGIYLWPEPFVIHGYGYATENDEEMLLWILYGDLATDDDLCKKSLRLMLKEFLLMTSSRLVEIVELVDNQINSQDDAGKNYSNLFYLLNSPNPMSDFEAKEYLESKMSFFEIAIKAVTCLPKVCSESLLTISSKVDCYGRNKPVININELETRASKLMTLLYKLTDRTEVLPIMEKDDEERKFVTLDTMQAFLQRCVNKVNKIEEPPATASALTRDIVDTLAPEKEHHHELIDKDDSNSDDDSIFGDSEIPSLASVKVPDEPEKANEEIRTSSYDNFTVPQLPNPCPQLSSSSVPPVFRGSLSTDTFQDSRVHVLNLKSLDLSEMNDCTLSLPVTNHSLAPSEPIIIFQLTSNSITMTSCSTGEMVENEFEQLVTSTTIGLTSKENQLVYGPRVSTLTHDDELSGSWSLQQLLQDGPNNSDVIIVNYRNKKYYPVTYVSTLAFLLKSMKKSFSKNGENYATNCAVIVTFQREGTPPLETIKNAALIAGFSSGAVISQSTLAAYTWMCGIKEKCDNYNHTVGKFLVLSQVSNGLSVAVYKCHFSEDNVELIACQTASYETCLNTDDDDDVLEGKKFILFTDLLPVPFGTNLGSSSSLSSLPSCPEEGKLAAARTVLMNMVGNEKIQKALTEVGSSLDLKSAATGAAILTESVKWHEIMEDVVSELGKMVWLFEDDKMMHVRGVQKLLNRFQKLDTNVFHGEELLVWRNGD